MPDEDPTRDYVLRALAASEIAETATRADLRESFTELSRAWLEKAGEAGGEPFES